MCRWDLSPAILLLFPADRDCKSPPCDSSMRWIGTWFWQLQAWQTAAQAGPTGAALPKRWLGKKKKDKKEKELKCWCFVVCIQRSPSAGQGENSPRSSARWGELSTLLFPLPAGAWGTPGIISLPGLHLQRLLKEHLSGARIESVFHGGWCFRMSVQRQGTAEN